MKFPSPFDHGRSGTCFSVIGLLALLALMTGSSWAEEAVKPKPEETPKAKPTETPAPKIAEKKAPSDPAKAESKVGKVPAKADEGRGQPAWSGPVHTLKPEKLEQKVKVTGTVQSLRETPLEMNLKRWSDLTVVRAAPHGTRVKAGDVVLELETRELVKKIGEMKREMPSKEIELAAAELELEKAEKVTPLSLEKASREKLQAEQDLAHFEDKDRPMRERAAREDVKEVAEALAYAQEELNQLKKMYEKDNLTEETEEIILRRAENSVARYQWMLEQTEARAGRTLEVLLPREHESLKRGLELKQIEWRAGERTLRDGLEKQHLATAAKRREMEEWRKNLEELEDDLSAMRVTAPHDGVVYYGMSQRAKWTTASLVDRRLIPGGKLTMREVFMTVAEPGKVQVLLSLTEEQLKDLAEGQTGVCRLKWNPDLEIPAKLESILPVPYADRTFDAIVSVKVPKDGPVVFPGVSADAEFVVYKKDDALLLPKVAVKKEGGRERVMLRDGKVVELKTGRSEGDRVEILEGLKAGDVVRLPEVKPEPKTEAKSEMPKVPGTPQAGAQAGKEG